MAELNANGDPERRERLARFIIDLSCNCSILPFTIVRPCEVRNAVLAFFGHPEPILIRSSLVREGIAHAHGTRLKIKGLSAKNEADVQQYIESAHASVQYLLAQGEDREEVERYRADERGTLGIQEQVRKRSKAEITLDQRYLAELFEFLGKGDVGKALIGALRETGVSISAFFVGFTNAAEFIRFFADIDTLHVKLTLALARDQDLKRKIHLNDSRDLIGLSVAIPYSNLVVTEKYWCHMARSSGLDRMYGTTIITDAREIPARLGDMGCL